MKDILILTMVVLSLTSCNSRTRNEYDTFVEMSNKSENIKEICGYKIGDSYNTVQSKCKSDGYEVTNTIETINDIIPDYVYKKDMPDWSFLLAEKNGKCKYVFEFYKRKLCLILIKDDVKLIDNIMRDNGLGIIEDSLCLVCKNYPKNLIHNLVGADYDYIVHCYANNFVLLGCSIYNGELSDVIETSDDVICVSRTYIDVLSNNVMAQKKELGKKIFGNGNSTNGSNNSQKRDRGTMDDNDREYWESVNREEHLRKIGMDDAADLEHKARIRYLEGGGYHSKDGGSQVHFQGSKEQEEQLRQMDEMGW